MLRFKARRLDPTKRETLTPSQTRFIRGIVRMWGNVREDVIANEHELVDSILHRSPQLTLALMPFEPLLDAQDFVYEELLAEVLDGGSRVKLPSIKKATVKFSFDRSRPEAAQWASNNAGMLINNFNREQEAVLRDLITRASMGELTVDMVGRQLRNSIGLTAQQADWVENRWQREFTSRVRDGWSARDAEALADQASNRYYEQVLRYRSETIARTEILKASHEGRREAWAQGIEGGWIGTDWEQEWDAANDACDICAPFNGTRAPVNGTFPDGEPPLHPNCRCDVLLVPPEIPQDVSEMTDEELDAELARLLSGDEEETPVNETPASLDEQIEAISAEREPIRQQLIAADAGEISLTPEQYDDLLAQHKPLFEEEMRLKEQLLEEQRAETVNASQDGVAAFEELSVRADFSDEELDALQRWEGDGYRSVQGALYNNSSLSAIANPDTADIVRGLDSAMQPLPQGTTLYRGQTRGLDNLVIGDEIESTMFTATTTDPITAAAFSKSAGQVLGPVGVGDSATILRITIDKGRGTVVPGSPEYEVVLRRSTKMRVTGFSRETIGGVNLRVIDVVAYG